MQLFLIIFDILFNMLQEARNFSYQVHKDIFHSTKTGIMKPQLNHIQEVADLVWISGGSDIEISAAWLHDSIEDTSTTIKDIEGIFGPEVAALVLALTDSPDLDLLSLKERKIQQAEILKNKNKSVKLIKLADQISNVKTLRIEPFANMSEEGRKDYLHGANLISQVCKGVSPLLDEIFEREYAKTIEFQY